MLATSAQVTLSRVRTWKVARAVDQRSTRSKIAARRAASSAAAHWLKFSGAARTVQQHLDHGGGVGVGAGDLAERHGRQQQRRNGRGRGADWDP
jgi:hypothetical protein